MISFFCHFWTILPSEWQKKASSECTCCLLTLILAWRHFSSEHWFVWLSKIQKAQHWKHKIQTIQTWKWLNRSKLYWRLFYVSLRKKGQVWSDWICTKCDLIKTPFSITLDRFPMNKKMNKIGYDQEVLLLLVKDFFIGKNGHM